MWPWPTLKEMKILAASRRGQCLRSGKRTAVAGGSARSSVGRPPGKGGFLPTISERSPSLLPPWLEVLCVSAGFTHIFNMPLNLSFSTELQRKEGSGELGSSLPWVEPALPPQQPPEAQGPHARFLSPLYPCLKASGIATQLPCPPSSGTTTLQGLQHQNPPSGETAESISHCLDLVQFGAVPWQLIQSDSSRQLLHVSKRPVTLFTQFPKCLVPQRTSLYTSGLHGQSQGVSSSPRPQAPGPLRFDQMQRPHKWVWGSTRPPASHLLSWEPDGS